MLNYITQLNTFENLCTGILPPKAQMIYYKLFKWSNRFGLGNPFRVANSILMLETGIKNVNTFTSNRNLLKQYGFIDFKPATNKLATEYILLDLTVWGNNTLPQIAPQTALQTEPQTALQTEPQTAPPYIYSINNIQSNKTKQNKTKKEKAVRHKFGQYQNVLLSDDELEKLKTEFPSDWQERIERVSEYCASKGATYKNYLATIRNWAKRDIKNKDQPARQPYRKNDVAGGYQRLMEILGGDEND